jgi:hypothetical protein
MMSSSGGLLRGVVRGMAAGAVGTVALTVAEQWDMKVTGRTSSDVPGQVGAHLLPGKDPHSAVDVAALNTSVHWVHGISMGALRGVLDAAGVRGSRATAAHFAVLWGGDAALYKALGIAESPWNWSGSELASDVISKSVYAVITGAVYDQLADNGF